MSPRDSDTHDHGPPLVAQAADAVRNRTAFPKLAVWTTSLSSPAVNSFSGAVAGMASGIVTCPLDVIKTKLQAQGSFANPDAKAARTATGAMYHGMVGTARTIIRQDGLKGMYRGLGPMLLGYLPTWAVYMAVYDSSREWYYTHNFGTGDGHKWLPRIYASITAGACSTIATNPIWVIKTRLMSQISRHARDGARTPWHYNNTLDAARKMYRAEGLGAFYSGLAPALLGLTHVAIQFPLYEYFKQQLTGLEMGETPTEQGKSWTNVGGILAATLLSKVCATSATYPHEVLRTRLQTQQRHVYPENSHNGVAASGHSPGSSSSTSTSKSPPSSSSSSSSSPSSTANTTGLRRPPGTSDGMHFQPRYKGIIRTCQIILREEGWRAFYNGMGTNMLRAVPAAMTTMLTYESIKGAIGRLQEEGKSILGEREEGLG